MSYLSFVVCILVLEAVVVVVSQQQQTCSGIRCKTDGDCQVNEQCQASPCGSRRCTAVQTLTCANVLCNTDTVCSYVTTCQTTCPIQPRCIPRGEVYDGMDNECRRLSYTNVVLVENPSNRSTYNQLTCTRSCPSGATCAGGLCCRGKVSVPLTKPGICPTNQVTGAVCKGTRCSNDYDCQGEQKCCTQCGKRCTDPIFVLNTNDCANTRCGKGEVCVMRTVCPEGMVCAQVLRPVCVPFQCANCDFSEQCIAIATGYRCSGTDSCGGCPRGKVCRPTGLRCVTVPCPQYSCVPDDECGGCPSGKVCKFTPIQCVTVPCPQYSCVSSDECGGCPQGQDCKRNTCATSLCARYKCYPGSP